MINSDYETENYLVTPRIVPADKRSKINIIPRGENASFLRAEKIIALELYAVSGLNSTGEYSALAEPTLEWVLNPDGSLLIEAFFTGEQEYSLLVKTVNFGHPDGAKINKVLQFAFYSVAEDLYGKYPFRGDLHMHSEHSDGELAPEFLAARGRELGMDFLAVTDHEKYAPGLEACRIMQDLPTGVLVCPGEEVQLPDTPVHIVNFGGNFSVNDLAKQDVSAYKQEAALLAEKMNIAERCDTFPVGAAQWAFEKIAQAGGLSIFSHCFWQKHQYMINEAVTCNIVEKCSFDAMEVISGHGTKNFWSNNLQSAYYNEFADKKRIAAVGCSDTHSAYLDNEFGCVYTICWAEELTKTAIIENIKNKYSAAAEEMTGSLPRFYGSYRLVRYAGFLRKHYFPQHDKLCAAEGILLKEVLSGRKELLPALKQTARAVEDYRKSLF